MQAVGRSVQDQVELLGNRANALQGAAQKGRQIVQGARSVQGKAFEGSFVDPRQDPGFIGHARSVRAKRQEVAAHFKHPLVLLQLLGNDVAEYAALLLFEVFAAGAQLIEHAARDERGRRELRVRVAEFLPGARAVVFENADVFQSSVVLEVLDALCG